jgi:hypothetical protein
MPRLLLKSLLSVMVMLSLNSRPTSAEVTTQLDPFACLDRKAKDRINEAFDTNFECHQSLAKAAKVERLDWETLILSVLGGVVAGMVVENQIRH